MEAFLTSFGVIPLSNTTFLSLNDLVLYCSSNLTESLLFNLLKVFFISVMVEFKSLPYGELVNCYSIFKSLLTFMSSIFLIFGGLNGFGFSFLLFYSDLLPQSDSSSIVSTGGFTRSYRCAVVYFLNVLSLSIFSDIG